MAVVSGYTANAAAKRIGICTVISLKSITIYMKTKSRKARGGELLRDKMSISAFGFVAHAKDTEGMFGLHSLS